MSQLFRLARKFLNVRREQKLRALGAKFIDVKHHSAAENVYHCCVWKTASQWVRNVFSSTAVYRYSGLLTYAYEHFEGTDERPLQERSFEKPFPKKKIVSPIYSNFASFANMPKPEAYRAFFVVRDPRDLVVSHYFSSRYSHVANKGVLEERDRLEGMSDSEGMLVHMKYMAERGIFDACASWATAADQDDRVKVIRFENITGPEQVSHWKQLMEHCDVQLPEKELLHILDRLSFQRLSGGRKPGEEDKHHKYRSGKPQDWKKYFTEEHHCQFRELTGDLISILGYPAAE